MKKIRWIYLRKMPKLPARAAKMNPTKKMTDVACTAVSTFFANKGNFMPTNIPRMTGMPRIRKTVRNISRGSMAMGTSRGECLAYRPPQKAKLKGVMKRLKMVVIPVRLTETVIFDLEM